MAAVSIRDLDDDVKERLRIRAARNGRSMEAEIRVILAEAVSDPRSSQDLFTALLDRVGTTAGADLDVPPRATRARAADLTA
jgi:antitoxin FitA